MASNLLTNAEGKRESPEEPEEIWQFHNSFGRKFNTKDYKIILPADSEEMARLDLMHKILTMALDSLYACPEIVQPLLAPRDGLAPGVLDLGSGSGVWAREMAEEFQFAEVLGIDVQPPPAEFEVDDMNLSISHYAHCFDVVHCRAIDFYVTDYPKFLYEIARVLRPNGVVLLVYPVKSLFNEKYEPMPYVTEEGQEGFYFTQAFFKAVHTAVKSRPGAEDAYLTYKKMLTENPNYDDESITIKELHIPISPWPERMNEHDKAICSMMGRQMDIMFKAYRPLVIAQGMDLAAVDRLLANMSLNTTSWDSFVR
ncbi:hypothetical protein FRB96_005823 [Tulasnella sp. 330]|nr:hypothetical protein FRB96_005823 [Tulasnella sp. 330]KAG8881072.1 hypothetical protein FRB97_000191 [Tulasnella sp. 331]